MAAITSALSALAVGYASVKQAETADMAAKEQIKMAEKQNKEAKAEIEEQKATALRQRKSTIDQQRMQMIGGGLNLNPTGNLGVLPNGGLLNSAPNYNALTGVTLG
jgi:Flp pilus assembly protein TadB